MIADEGGTGSIGAIGSPVSIEEFDPRTRADWETAASDALRGRPVSSLDRTTDDGVVVPPIVAATDLPPTPEDLPGFGTHIRGRSAGGGRWDIRQLVEHPDPATANDEIFEELERGATSVALALAVGGKGPGVVVHDAADLAAALDGVLLDLAGVALDAGPHQMAAARWYVDNVEAAGEAGTDSLGSLGVDPVGALARHGWLEADLDATWSAVARLVERVRPLSGIVPLRVDATVVADAGGDAAVELAFALSSLVAALRGLEAAGVEPDEVVARVEMRFDASPDQFATIAKLRAARRCLTRVVEAATDGRVNRPPRLHAVTSASAATAVEPWVNVLRTTTAAFGAVVGGAGSVTVRPMAWTSGLATEADRRLARNTQLLLAEETHLDQVTDPAGGSFFVERRTDDLARSAWQGFRELEADGGIVAALRSGAFQRSLAATWTDRRLPDLAARRRPLTGVSEFADLDAEPVARVNRPVDPPVPDTAGTRVDPLPVRRLADPFERLRRAATALRSPTVFLANLGPVASHTTRATFAANAFEAGGIRPLGNDGFADAAALADGFAASGARIACLCGADGDYDAWGAPAATALRDAGCERVYLAGTADVAGVHRTFALGSDLVALLTDVHDHLQTDAASAVTQEGAA